MVELPKTEAELQALLDARTQEVTDTLTAKHNSDMANMRQKHANELAKAKEQANKSAEEIAAEKLKEQQQADAQELAELRQFKKSSVLVEKLKKEGLPDFFKNDNRLLTAEDGNIDKVIKDIKKEYEAVQPKGATRSTIVTTQSQSAEKGGGDSKQKAVEAMSEALKDLIS